MKVSLVLLAALGLLPMAQAQTPHTPPSPAQIAQHEVQRYTTLLTLTPGQVEQATAYFTADATTRANARASEKAAHETLEAAIKAGEKDTIQSTATTLGQMSGELLASHAWAEAQFYGILNTEQKTKFSALEEEHMMGGGFHGPPGR
jgi:Spy/CpxP family protein refolding chaperone